MYDEIQNNKLLPPPQKKQLFYNITIFLSLIGHVFKNSKKNIYSKRVDQ